MKSSLKLPIGVQSFEIMQQENYVYIDKTEQLYHLVQKGRVYFLSRPRRFGKSLLLSTLAALFQAKRHLFQDLWIEKSDYTWLEYPVIYLDMSTFPNTTTALLNENLTRRLVTIAQGFGLTINPKLDPSTALQALIEALAENNKKVVVLIDEYDKPLLDQISNIKVALDNRELLKHFYGILKSQDQNLRFVMLTGVSKFSKVSVFSGLNNLNDISLSTNYASLLGYTQQELEHYFTPWLKQLSETEQSSYAKLLVKIKHWYNGYQFSDRDLKVYNPFSTLLLLDHQRFMPYWFATGTPTFLLTLIAEKQFNAADIENLRVSESAFSVYEVDQLEVLPLLYQTGYLTIKDYDKQFMSYRLGYPNWEVESSFIDALLVKFSNVTKGLSDSFIFEMTTLLQQANFEDFFGVLKRFLASIPYELQMPGELYYQNIFYFLFTLLGLRLNAEVHTNRGRIDAAIELENAVFIFEFKLDKTAQAALEQIHQRGYAERYRDNKKKIYLLGVNFSTEARNVDSWLLEVL